MNANQQVATQPIPKPMDVFKNQLQGALPTMVKLLPAHITREKFEAMVVGTIIGNPDLLNAERGSLMQAVADTADLGLSLNKQMREADILLVSGKAQMRPRYEGLVKLARQSGEIIDIYAHEVYANDHFDYDLGINKKLEHKPAPEDNRGDLLQLAYCVWETKDHVKGFEVIGAKRIARAKAASEGFKAFTSGKIKSTPWVTDEAQMIRKTAIRAAAPYLPKSTESDKFQRALAMSDDTRFEDDDHDGVPAAPRIVPPRPTRASMAAAAAEEQRRRDQYRETMNEDDQTGGNNGRDTREGDQVDGDPRDAADRRGHGPGDDGDGTQGAQGGQGDPGTPEGRAGGTRKSSDPEPAPWFESMKPADVRSRLIKEMIKASDLTALAEFEQRNVDAIAWLAGESEAEHKKVRQALEGKIATYNTAAKQR